MLECGSSDSYSYPNFNYLFCYLEKWTSNLNSTFFLKHEFSLSFGVSETKKIRASVLIAAHRCEEAKHFYSFVNVIYKDRVEPNAPRPSRH